MVRHRHHAPAFVRLRATGSRDPFVAGALNDFAAWLERLAGNPEEGGHMDTGTLRAVEVLLRQCLELAHDAKEEALTDALLCGRLAVLASTIEAELASVAADIAARTRRAAHG